MTPDIETLKLKCAAKLSDELDSYGHSCGIKYIRWIHKNREVEETELLEIVHRVEKMMNAKEQVKYVESLCIICLGHDSIPLTIVGVWFVTHAKLEEKLQALHNCGFLQ